MGSGEASLFNLIFTAPALLADRSLITGRVSNKLCLFSYVKKAPEENRVPFCFAEDEEFYRLLDPFKTEIISSQKGVLNIAKRKRFTKFKQIKNVNF